MDRLSVRLHLPYPSIGTATVLRFEPTALIAAVVTHEAWAILFDWVDEHAPYGEMGHGLLLVMLGSWLLHPMETFSANIAYALMGGLGPQAELVFGGVALTIGLGSWYIVLFPEPRRRRVIANIAVFAFWAMFALEFRGAAPTSTAIPIYSTLAFLSALICAAIARPDPERRRTIEDVWNE